MFTDISNNQGNIDIKNVVISNNLDFAFVKSSEGVGWEDSKCSQYVSQLRDLNKPIGFYHFVRWDNSGNNATNEANSFANIVSKYYREGDFLALDFEVSTSGRSAYDLCSLFIDIINNKFPKQDCWLYANTSTFNSNNLAGIGAPNWVADYGVNNGTTNTKPSIANLIAWQYTSVGSLSGYSGNLDLDNYYGDIDTTTPNHGNDFQFKIIQDKVYNGLFPNSRVFILYPFSLFFFFFLSFFRPFFQNTR